MLDISQTVFGDVTEDVAHAGKNLQHGIPILWPPEHLG
jgi:hypothetical protein